ALAINDHCPVETKTVRKAPQQRKKATTQTRKTPTKRQTPMKGAQKRSNPAESKERKTAAAKRKREQSPAPQRSDSETSDSETCNPETSNSEASHSEGSNSEFVQLYLLNPERSIPGQTLSHLHDHLSWNHQSVGFQRIIASPSHQHPGQQTLSFVRRPFLRPQPIRFMPAVYSRDPWVNN
ncbi:hypothetical protein GOODEAATRI_021854, partial [Goodea atripinnis]